MNRITTAVGAALALAAMGCGTVPDAANDTEAEEASAATPAELDVDGVSARLAAGEDIFLLDVRTSEELQQDGAIEGYTHIPIAELEGRLAEVPKDKPIVAY
jgi:hypothetical protein